MAEGVFRDHVNFGRPDASELIRAVDSCGTAAYHAGQPPDPRTLTVLARNGIRSDFYTHKARKFKPADFTEYQYIFAMDNENKEDLEDLRNTMIKRGQLDDKTAGQVILFGAFGGKGEEQVDDPYYGGAKGFDIAYEQVRRFSKGFIDFLEKQNS